MPFDTPPRPHSNPESNPMKERKPSEHLKEVLFGSKRQSTNSESVEKKYSFPGEKPSRISLGSALGGIIGGMPQKKSEAKPLKKKEKPSQFSTYFRRNNLEQELEKNDYYDPKYFQKKDERKDLVKKWFGWDKFPKQDISQEDVKRARKSLQKEYWAEKDYRKRFRIKHEIGYFEKIFGEKQ